MICNFSTNVKDDGKSELVCKLEVSRCNLFTSDAIMILQTSVLADYDTIQHNLTSA